MSRYQKGKTNLDFTGARDSERQWHQLGHMQVCTSLQTDNHASTPPLSSLQAGCPSCRPTNSVKALKGYRHVTDIRISAHFTHLRKFRNFFATEVTIFSNHNPLMYLRECSPKSAKLTRWALGLQEFMHDDCNIFHTSVYMYTFM